MIVDVNGEKRISEDFLRYDQDWTHYIGRAQEDIQVGRNDPIWLEQAAAANQQRANGDFDDWKDREYELFWGTKQKLPSNVLAGSASHVKFDDLIEHGLIRPGDTFLYQRVIFRILIEKEAKVSYGFDVLSAKEQRLTCCLVHRSFRPRSQEEIYIQHPARSTQIYQRRPGRGR